jgi:preprotein translocase subunit SecG
MEAFIAVLHIIVALVLIGLVLIQDTKSGSVGGAFGGGGSNSVLGATGATTLAQKVTRWTAAIFAISCLTLSVFSTRTTSSVLDSAVGGGAIPQAATLPTPAAATTGAAPSAATSPAAAPAANGK